MKPTRQVLLTIAAAAIPLLFFPTGAGAANIVWITENTDAANPPSPDDVGWTDLLTANGHTVVRRDVRDLDVNPGGVTDLNAADLVIVSRDTNSGNYNNGGAGGVEATAWNSLTSPLILMSSYLVRSSHWKWFNNTGNPTHSGNMDVLDPGHAIFAGITLDANDEFAAIESGSVNLTGSPLASAGNATVLATAPNGGNIWIALFDAGVEFYAGSGQTPAATRMWFSGGITNNNPKGAENFNADGETAFLNAVTFLTGPPIADNDSDGDGMDDQWEINNFGDLSRDGLGDEDNDAATDRQEHDAGSNPNNTDTDGDTLTDGAEINTHGSDPTMADTDGDSLTDDAEVNTHGTDPSLADTDGDGLSDGVEISEDNGFVTDPSNDDTDGDGFDDGNELAEGSNPTDPGDVPEVGLTILLLGGATGPTAGADSAIMTFLQDSYGTQNVTYMQSSIAQPGDELGFGALLLSSTFGSGSARGKFQDSPVPILNWEEALTRNAGGEFAVTDGRTKENAAHSITINVEHPITAGFQAGQLVQMTTGAAEFWWSTGLQAPGAVSLASDDTNPRNGFLTIVEAGDELLTGQPAPARRIMLGITDNTFNFFTDDARTLFGQSIDWLLGLSDNANRFQLTEVSHDPASGLLSISWESTAGKLYNLHSTLDPGSATPLEWPIFGGNVDLVATPPENTLTIPLPDDLTRLFVVEEFNAPPVILFADDLESGAQGWSTIVNDATENTRWELGSPSGSTGPLTGAGDSATAWCTNLGDYGPDSDISLRSPAFNLSGVASAELTFKAFRDADGFGDSAVVRFLRSADLLQLGAETAIDMTVFDPDYTTLEVPVPTEALGENVIIEWTFVSDGSADAFSGLTIDDIEVIE